MPDEIKKAILNNDLKAISQEESNFELNSPKNILLNVKSLSSLIDSKSEKVVNEFKIEDIFAEIDGKKIEYYADHRFTYIKEQFADNKNCLRERYTRIPLKQNQKLSLEKVLLISLICINFIFLFNQNKLIEEFHQTQKETNILFTEYSKKIDKFFILYNELKQQLNLSYVKKFNTQNLISSNYFAKQKQKRKVQVNKSKTNKLTNQLAANNKTKTLPIKGASLVIPNDLIGKENLVLKQVSKPSKSSAKLIDNYFTTITPIYNNSVDDEIINKDNLYLIKTQKENVSIDTDTNVIKSSKVIPMKLKKATVSSSGNYSYTEMFDNVKLYKGQTTTGINIK